MKRKRQNFIIENVTVLDIAAEGKSVARYNDKVIFIDYVAPNDVLDLRIIKDKKNFANAVPIKFHSYSELRETPFCEHFGTCGGCKWQHIKYEAQLHYKAKQVKDNLERIGKVSLPPMNPILGSAKQKFYRNKLEYTFSDKRWLSTNEISTEGKIDRDALGFHIPGRFDKILDINTCYLQKDPSNAIRLELRRFAIEKGLSFFNLIHQKGFLRNLIIRTSSTGDLMAIVQFFQDEPENIIAVMDHLKNIFLEITSLQYVINSKGNETFHDQELICYHGKPYISEQMEGLEFRIGPKSFYQTNSEQAYELYKIVRTQADLKGHETVYDLYTGTGTIANFIAKNAKKVIGLEYVPMSIEDAKVNSAINNISNTDFFAGDIKDLLSDDFVNAHGKPDVIITDPPRAGMHEDVVNMLKKIEAEKIVYVSCNPATQARDLAWLDEKYEIMEVQPVDMFPHTHHVENVVLLKLRR